MLTVKVRGHKAVEVIWSRKRDSSKHPVWPQTEEELQWLQHHSAYGFPQVLSAIVIIKESEGDWDST